MGFLPGLKKILMWIYKKITESRIFNSFFSLFIPGQLFARQNFLNSNFGQNTWMYLPFFWSPPFSIIVFLYMWKAKSGGGKRRFKIQPKKYKMTMREIFAWIMITIFSWMAMIPIPIALQTLTGADGIGEVVDRFLPSWDFGPLNFIIKVLATTLIQGLAVFVFTTFIEFLKYRKKCIKRGKAINYINILTLGIQPSIAAMIPALAFNFIPPDMLELAGAITRIPVKIMPGLLMGLFHFITINFVGKGFKCG